MDSKPELWVRSQLGDVEMSLLRVRPWATVWRVTAAEGRWWLKVNGAGTGYEPRLLAVLDGVSPLVTAALVHPEWPWSLVADAGEWARNRLVGADAAAVVSLWCHLLPAYAELQRAVGVAPLLNAGVPDLRPATWLAALDQLLADGRWFSPEVAQNWTPAKRERLTAVRPALAGIAEELAGGVAATLDHGDLHDGNVFLAGPQVRVIDWGDAVVSHPFTTLGATFNALAARLGVSPGDRLLDRVRDAYLEPWTGGGQSRAGLRRQVALARQGGCLLRALGWVRALGTPEAGSELGFSSAPAGSLVDLVDALEGKARVLA